MQILLIRSQKCCKSNHVERFLEESGLPYVVKYVDDPGAEEIIEKFGIKASPGIILGEQPIN
jgi:arsenate reductase-like glutaredoxin family protein